jgi:hypothetical protein
MQELRLVAVSEDGSYAILAVPGRGGRFSLPIDERLRTVARGQFSRLAQYEIEVENPLRPKEIQDRIRAGETAEEIADAAGIPVDKVRRFEGPPTAERERWAQEAQQATVRGHGESGPGPRLGDVVAERLASAGADPDNTRWDSRKRPDGNWQVRLEFVIAGQSQLAQWVFDPRRRHVTADDDQAVRLCLPQTEWPADGPDTDRAGSATVTPIGSRLAGHHPPPERPEPDRPTVGIRPELSGRGARAEEAAAVAAGPAAAGPGEGFDPVLADPSEDATDGAYEDAAAARAPGRRARSRSRRSSVPSWDEIMFGTSRQPD